MSACRFLLFVLGLSVSSQLLAAVSHSVGIARDAEDRTIRYVEHHQYLASGEHLVRYFDANGSLMVTKKITYPSLPQHPEIDQTDLTKNTQVRTTNSARSVTMLRNMSGVSESLEVALDNTTIIDAGFDSFLRSQWQTFSVGESQTFKLAVVGKESLLKVQITKQAVTNSNTTFKIEPKNFFIRMLVPEMLLIYGPDRQLLTYKGLTNLNLPSGEDRNVIVTFSNYTSPGQLSKPLPQWLPNE